MNRHQARRVPNWKKWSFIRPFYDSALVRASALFPLFGYLIIFNDYIASKLDFTYLSGTTQTLIFSTEVRLQAIYFGLLFLGIYAGIFRYFCPNPIRLFRDRRDHRDKQSTGLDPEEIIEIFFRLEIERMYGRFGDTSFDRDDLYAYVGRVIPCKTDEIVDLEDDELMMAVARHNASHEAAVHSKSFISDLLDTEYDFAEIEKPKPYFFAAAALGLSVLLLSLPSIDIFLTVISNLG